MFKGGGDISSIDSELYFKRFMKFVERIIVPVNIPSVKKKGSSSNKILKN